MLAQTACRNQGSRWVRYCSLPVQTTDIWGLPPPYSLYISFPSITSFPARRCTESQHQYRINTLPDSHPRPQHHTHPSLVTPQHQPRHHPSPLTITHHHAPSRTITLYPHAPSRTITLYPHQLSRRQRRALRREYIILVRGQSFAPPELDPEPQTL